jgi:hypothetical protein
LKTASGGSIGEKILTYRSAALILPTIEYNRVSWKRGITAMKDKKNTAVEGQTMQQLIDSAIKSEIGDIDQLPRSVAARVRDLYGEFIPVYAEMIRIKENQHRDWRPAILPIDPDMVEEMLHFFSDYQHLTRAFKRLNREVKILLALDRQSEPRRYDEWVESIVSGGNRPSLMKSILEE